MAAMNYTISYYLLVTLCQLAILVGLYSSSGLAHAKSVRVGGDAGWTSADPETGLVPDYAAWAASQTLSVQDILGEYSSPNSSNHRPYRSVFHSFLCISRLKESGDGHKIIVF